MLKALRIILGAFSTLILGTINYKNSNYPDSYSFSFNFTSGVFSNSSRGLSTNGTISLPTFGAKRILINSNSGCILSGDVSGTLSNNKDISQDSLITIVCEYSNGTPDSNSLISCSGSLSLTLIMY